ncbi:hypothetical protein [Crocinitomix algicola]|uniref:hypothetical protein n=1 Tax=Crocinitomix algicola TaxID=1740263 RepID=UPI00082F0B90|nr:hypothetical protein [Crocinitomix algicola]
MLVNLFKSKTPVAIFSLPLLICVLGLPLFFNTADTPASFFTWEAGFIGWVYSNVIFHYLFSIIIIYLGAIEVNRLVNVYGFYGKNTYLAGLFYVLLIFTFTHFHFSLDLLAILFLGYGLGFLFRINRQDKANSAVFMAALFIGGATVFTPVVAPLVLLPWFTLVIFRSFIWREWMMLILGIALPWFYHYAIVFLSTGQLDIRREGLTIINDSFQWFLHHTFLIGFIVLVLLWGSWQYAVIARTALLAFKKRSRILFHFVWLSLIPFGLSWFLFDEPYFAFVIPYSVMLCVVFLKLSSALFANILLGLWLVLLFWDFLG